jgi:hypothetical protein
MPKTELRPLNLFELVEEATLSETEDILYSRDLSVFRDSGVFNCGYLIDVLRIKLLEEATFEFLEGLMKIVFDF